MSIVEWVDEKALQFFTNISHKFQRFTGRTNYFLAWCSGVVMAASCFVRILNYWMPVLAVPTGFPSLLLEVLLLAVASAQIIAAAILENKYLADPSSLPVDERFNTPFLVLVRAISLVYTTILTPIALPIFMIKTGSIILEILAGNTLTAVCCFHYFMAVTPLPPCRGKIREWVSKFVEGFPKSTPVSVKN